MDTIFREAKNKMSVLTASKAWRMMATPQDEHVL
jgi:hypothetical protein